MVTVKRSALLAALFAPVLAVSAADAAPKTTKNTNATTAAAAASSKPAAKPRKKSAKPAKKKGAAAATTPSADASATTTAPAPAAAPPAPPPPPAPVAAEKPAPAPAHAAVSTTTTTSAEAPTAEKPAARTNGDPLGTGLSFAPIVDYGTSAVYGLGAGARVGYTMPARVFIGGTAMYHMGGSTNGPLSYAFFYVGPEVGYDIPMGPVVLRPFVGGGYGMLMTSMKGTMLIPGGGGTGVTTTLHGRSMSATFWPGAALVVALSDKLSAGADVRVLLAPGQDASAGTISSAGGVAPQGGSVSSSVPSSTAVAAGATLAYRF